MKQFKRLIHRAITWWNGSLPGRTLARFTGMNGALTASGMAYSLLFAFFAAVWALFSLLSLVASGNEQLLHTVASALGQAVPGLTSGPGGGVVSVSALRSASVGLSWSGLVSLVVLWWTVTGWLGTARLGVLDMFDHPRTPPTLIRARLRDTGAAALVGVLFVVSAVGMVASAGAVRTVLGWLGLPSDGFWVGVGVEGSGLLGTLVVDVLLLVVLFRLVARVPAPRRTVWIAAGLGGVGVAVLQVLGSRLMGGATSNPLLAPFAAVVGILIWFNLVSQVVVLASALLGELSAGRSAAAAGK
jgi:membrane protein